MRSIRHRKCCLESFATAIRLQFRGCRALKPEARDGLVGVDQLEYLNCKLQLRRSEEIQQGVQFLTILVLSILAFKRH